MPIQKRKIAAGAVTVLVLFLLLAAGPARAFTLNLNADKDVVEQGKKIIFTAFIEISSGEALDIDEIILVLDGPEHRECSFDVTGKMKSGMNAECHGINIKKLAYPKIEKGYGYGYGYSYGYGITEDLEYEITLHSQKFDPGAYKTSLKINSEGKEFEEQGPDFEIKEKKQEKEGKKVQGGGGSPEGCLTQWECEEWSECEDGKQERKCHKAENRCEIKQEKPEEKRECNIETLETEAEETEKKSKTKKQAAESEEQTPETSSIITGAFAAVTEQRSWIAAAIILAIAAGAGIIGIKFFKNKRKMKKFFSYKNYDFY